MSKNFILKSLSIVIIGIILFFLTFGVYLGHKFYNSIFRLSLNQISGSLSNTIPQCRKISDCKLLSGDILIRRYITSKTWDFDRYIRPYFTHSTFYLGDDKIVEAVGTEKNPQDEIQISTLSKSDWLDNGVESFVIIRPKYIIKKLDKIKNNLITIAKDPNYKFGLPDSNKKQATCADLILEQLIKEKVITIPSVPKIITPDYLFWLAKNNPNDLEIIGYHI